MIHVLWRCRFSLAVAAAAAMGVRCGSEAAAQTVPEWRLTDVHEYPESDRAPLTFVSEMRDAGANGGVYVSDLRTPGILEFDGEGRLVRVLGTRGEGPGEFERVWRFGVRDDTVWAIDGGTPRLALFDREGRVARTIRSASLGHIEGYLRIVPMAWLGGEAVLVIAEEDTRMRVLRALRVEGHAVKRLPLALHQKDRWFVIPEPGRPPGTSSYHQPFGHYDLMGVGGDGRGVWTVVRGPNGSRGAGLPAGVGSFELRGFEEGRGARQLTIAYPLREMTRDHIESWFEGWKRAPIIRFWLDRGVFPSMAAIREAAVGALEIPQYLPPVSNAGSGLKDRGILVTDEGILLEEWHDREPGDARWMVVDPERGLVAYLTVPAPYRLMDLSARWAWCVRIDEFDRPILARFRVIRQQGR